MFTDSITKQFAIQVIGRDIKNIYSAQLLIAQKNIYVEGRDLRYTKRKGATLAERSRTGNLVNALQNPDFKIQAGDAKITVINTISKRLRFLDMRDHGNWRIYNRQVWGILYNNALQDIKAGYGNQIHDYVGKMLSDALGSPEGKKGQ
jgi:hypothetical protein